jgi:hypothetical protein
MQKSVFLAEAQRQSNEKYLEELFCAPFALSAGELLSDESARSSAAAIGIHANRRHGPFILNTAPALEED